MPSQRTNLSFDQYLRDDGVALGEPSFFEIGGDGASGVYAFEPSVPTGYGIAYVVACSGTVTPKKQAGFLRAEDWNTDGIPAIQDDVTALRSWTEGRWKIHTSGPDANRLVLYQPDGTTVLAKFDLKNAAGAATTVNPYERVPV